jgi:hypothetical protein
MIERGSAACFDSLLTASQMDRVFGSDQARTRACDFERRGGQPVGRCIAGFQSPLCPVWVIRDLGRRSHTMMYVRFTPKADKRADVSPSPLSAKSGREQMQRGAVLFDHFVGNGEHAWRDCEAERLGGLHVDDQLELGWQLHRKFGGLVAFENAISIDCRLPK